MQIGALMLLRKEYLEMLVKAVGGYKAGLKINSDILSDIGRALIPTKGSLNL